MRATVSFRVDSDLDLERIECWVSAALIQSGIDVADLKVAKVPDPIDLQIAQVQRDLMTAGDRRDSDWCDRLDAQLDKLVKRKLAGEKQ